MTPSFLICSSRNMEFPLIQVKKTMRKTGLQELGV